MATFTCKIGHENKTNEHATFEQRVNNSHISLSIHDEREQQEILKRKFRRNRRGAIVQENVKEYYRFWYSLAGFYHGKKSLTGSNEVQRHS